jgi:hypothetical protein
VGRRCIYIAYGVVESSPILHHIYRMQNAFCLTEKPSTPIGTALLMLKKSDIIPNMGASIANLESTAHVSHHGAARRGGIYLSTRDTDDDQKNWGNSRLCAQADDMPLDNREMDHRWDIDTYPTYR